MQISLQIGEEQTDYESATCSVGPDFQERRACPAESGKLSVGLLWKNTMDEFLPPEIQ
ncbi:hypothetical protein SAMN05444280_11973 [Tangfeifania diversioriginum]|uniref:Uncharacterized protein n=1 Tax=Tangfeifania diversioriginum TaxID=1168035 RepID=A0A1M6JB80_9BACT|nr:hypothetical protein SAMN05444280_11973 [Tangfeifania diversioriginum]